MAVLYAYGYKPKPSHVDEDVHLADLSGQGHGPDLFNIIKDVLWDNGAEYEVPGPPAPGQEDIRSKYLRITPSEIDADSAARTISGRVWMFRKGEAERKTKRATGQSEQYEDDDTGDRPLFFLFSVPKQASEALLILESARPYGMTSFWGNELKRLISDRIPSDVYSVTRGKRAVTKDIVLRWGAYGALETPEFIDRFFEGTISEAAATNRTAGPDGDEHRMVQVVRSQEVEKGKLAQLIRDKRRKDVAELIFPAGMTEALGGDPDEVKFRGRFSGSDRVIVVTRKTVSQPGIEIPRVAERDEGVYSAYAKASVLRALAESLAVDVGHGHIWPEE